MSNEVHCDHAALQLATTATALPLAVVIPLMVLIMVAVMLIGWVGVRSRRSVPARRVQREIDLQAYLAERDQQWTRDHRGHP